MKMPFGKYKGKEVKNLPFSYIKFLCSINIYGKLKNEQYRQNIVERRNIRRGNELN